MCPSSGMLVSSSSVTRNLRRTALTRTTVSLRRFAAEEGRLAGVEIEGDYDGGPAIGARERSHRHIGALWGVKVPSLHSTSTKAFHPTLH
jgi:hypothetical protein